MASYYNNENIPIKVNGFINFDSSGNVVLVEENNKRKANNNYDNYFGPGDYECNICHKKFVKKSYWKRHELSHEKKFSCNICGREFMHNTHLTQHMLVHQEKKHKCDVCGIMMRHKFNLKKHRKMHIPYRDENGEIKYLTIK